ncbi:primosomal protein N' [Compostibacillus humi]|uniref:Replication restart protein PriA n=1 Tax=Compostibacillus humi TaxID=1245525 RepID=A0A8J2ZQJ9_9BACI|nr:primosomal protein N' [Compostibacillus humi]GGH69269.1 primosomal protein N' [Compostibacillus humi]
MKIAKVIVDVPSNSLNKAFDYVIPGRFSRMVEKGMRVVVPFGPRKIMGFVVEITDESEAENVKEIIDVLDVAPVLTEELLELGNWLADRTVSLTVTALQAMLPQVLKSKYKKEIVRRTEEMLPEPWEFLFQGRDVIPFEEFANSPISYHQLQKAVHQGDVEISYVVKSRITKKFVTMVRPKRDSIYLEEALLDLPKNAKKQRKIIDYFLAHPNPVEQNLLCRKLDTTASTIKNLAEKGLIETFRKEVFRNPFHDEDIERTSPLPLTDEQKNAFASITASIENGKHDVFLLHGVTGSGKTEVYLQAIQKVIEKGKEAIVLVPEISLTPQMVRRFKSRFGKNVAVMHSALSAGEKYDEWRKIQQKKVQVVVGARSAIFAPFENIGIIIIDEEHETSYKQEDQPRYHARDVAIRRGKYHQCPVVLGSATPSLESYARAIKGIYHLCELTKRTNNQPMPQVDIVDMRKELHAGNRTMFSRNLMEKLEDRLLKGEQSVLLLNRRGYSTFVMCRECGHVNKCPHCDIALTYHKKSGRLKCHYCTFEEFVPSVCPSCQSSLIRFFGTGTERVEEALTKLIPEARVLRMDVDTTRKKGAHEKILKQFGEGKADILLGTQMIAKGLDFENVTLVGVLTADSMLHLPDFRSSEKTFQLLTQVSGRAGRHERPGEVVVQTYTPEHYAVQLASEYDFAAFFQQEMKMRKSFQYPPYVYLALITISCENRAMAIQSAQRFAQLLLKMVNEKTVILGPTPSPIPKINDKYRYQCIVKYKYEPKLAHFLRKAANQFEEIRRKYGLQIIIDMEPYHLM